MTRAAPRPMQRFAGPEGPCRVLDNEVLARPRRVRVGVLMDTPMARPMCKSRLSDRLTGKGSRTRLAIYRAGTGRTRAARDPVNHGRAQVEGSTEESRLVHRGTIIRDITRAVLCRLTQRRLGSCCSPKQWFPRPSRNPK